MRRNPVIADTEVTVINICRLLDDIRPGWDTAPYDYEADHEAVYEWCRVNNAAYYEASREYFSLGAAREIARSTGATKVVVCDLS